ncbi:MAG: glycosyltransferase family 4 protein [Prolixibacteraceae bacterium]|nr:glycosyltransferase family 4 protein [Prolixibacteraceae bacterium]
MNICLVSTSYPPEDVGGIGTYIYNLAQGLVELGHNVFVITQSRLIDSRKASTQEGVTVIRIPMQQIPFVESFFPGLAWSWVVSQEIERLDRNHRIDVVEFPNWEGPGFVYLMKFKRRRVVTRMHTPYFESLKIKEGKLVSFGDRFTCLLEKLSCQMSDVLTSSTNYHKNMMSEEYNFASRNTHIIPLGLKYPKVVPSKTKKEKITILYVSRMETRKGTIDFINVIPDLLSLHDNIEFILIGQDRPLAPGNITHEEYFKKKYKDNNSQVKFLGCISDNERDHYYSECDIFVVPSIYESFGLIFVEAMSYAKPVIGCVAGGVPEVVSNGESGILVETGNLKQLREAISKLINDEELRLTIGMAARRSVEQKFNYKKMSELTEKLYKEVVLHNC